VSHLLVDYVRDVHVHVRVYVSKLGHVLTLDIVLVLFCSTTNTLSISNRCYPTAAFSVAIHVTQYAQLRAQRRWR